MKRISIIASVLFLISNSVNSQNQEPSIQGELKKWHKVTLSFKGEQLSENDAENPFLNYRLNVTFKNGNKTYIVPGFYAADGNASETSADSGNIWEVRFTPDETGEWSYETSFRKGKRIAINEDLDAGESVSFDGMKGSFKIADSDKTGVDFRGKGKLRFTGERYLQFADTKDYFIKGGAGSPETFLGYYEFDQTPPTHKYEPHSNDWKAGDPTWQDEKGKNIIGALNYLASEGMNSVYFLTMSVQGDGKDVWPWNDMDERYRYDCSKLGQWEIVFDHMDKLGLMLHVITQETENELLLDIGELGVQRKLYYRELIARFSHHLGVTWNLGEENGPVVWSPKGQNDEDRRQMAEYLKKTDPYKNAVVLHTHSIKHQQERFLFPMLGFEYLDGPSLQIHDPNEVNEVTERWLRESKKAGHVWMAPLDEIGPADTGAKPDTDDTDHDEMRHKVLWGNLMAGGAGVEWYFGYKYAHNDLACEDWRSRDKMWDQTKYALDFFQGHLPFAEMKSANGLTDNPDDYVFAQNGTAYAIYLPKVAETKIDLFGFNTAFTVQWFNPRTGGKLQKGTVKTVKGGTKASIGFPPYKEKDWVAVLKAKKPMPQIDSGNNEQKVIVLEAVNDFEINPSQAAGTYYKDAQNGALAIDAADKQQRDKFAEAGALFNGTAGVYNVSFVSMSENDGESPYVIKLNGTVVDTLVNPRIDATFGIVNHNLGEHYLQQNDIIQVASKAVTNGLIPENDETAWSRGRWNKLILTPSGLSMDEQLKDVVPFEEKDGFLEVEAENYHYNSFNGTDRKWYIRSQNSELPFESTTLTDHFESASNNAYIEALPDTRITHDDVLTIGDNFFPDPGLGGIVSYKINITTPGKYYIWASAFSTGTEDNGVHVGLDGEWTESGARMQWCGGKDQWTWSSAQRVPDNHCGVPQTIFLDIKTTGNHFISFSMREDGFEMDKWMMTTDCSLIPE